ncbi:hypothetical protein KIPB_001793 [Kipferlia bialata]|uniref:Uncharacterized protein n=1 Tax=Kipferlia bialata TaxID=797122 RepID=A0A9K3CP66_9EUKA|nr:hypothetical protein KIPB_001793 [Kipferlia bialata]|eukprot:g1793.t1
MWLLGVALSLVWLLPLALSSDVPDNCPECLLEGRIWCVLPFPQADICFSSVEQCYAVGGQVSDCSIPTCCADCLDYDGYLWCLEWLGPYAAANRCIPEASAGVCAFAAETPYECDIQPATDCEGCIALNGRWCIRIGYDNECIPEGAAVLEGYCADIYTSPEECAFETPETCEQCLNLPGYVWCTVWEGPFASENRCIPEDEAFGVCAYYADMPIECGVEPDDCEGCIALDGRWCVRVGFDDECIPPGAAVLEGYCNEIYTNPDQCPYVPPPMDTCYQCLQVDNAVWCYLDDEPPKCVDASNTAPCVAIVEEEEFCGKPQGQDCLTCTEYGWFYCARLFEEDECVQPGQEEDCDVIIEDPLDCSLIPLMPTECFDCLLAGYTWCETPGGYLCVGSVQYCSDIGGVSVSDPADCPQGPLTDTCPTCVDNGYLWCSVTTEEDSFCTDSELVCLAAGGSVVIERTECTDPRDYQDCYSCVQAGLWWYGTRCDESAVRDRGDRGETTCPVPETCDECHSQDKVWCAVPDSPDLCVDTLDECFCLAGTPVRDCTIPDTCDDCILRDYVWCRDPVSGEEMCAEECDPCSETVVPVTDPALCTPPCTLSSCETCQAAGYNWCLDCACDGASESCVAAGYDCPGIVSQCRDTSLDVKPRAVCYDAHSDEAVFEASNYGPFAVVPVGVDNWVCPGGPSVGQPLILQTGQTTFRTKMEPDSDVTVWHLDGREATVSRSHSPRCQEHEDCKNDCNYGWGKE